MFLKIRIRTVLLSIFENAGYSLENSLANYIYNDGLNMWIDLLKKHPGSAEDKAIFVIENVVDGTSVEKFQSVIGSGESYKPADLVDDALKEKVDSISDADSRKVIKKLGALIHQYRCIQNPPFAFGFGTDLILLSFA